MAARRSKRTPGRPAGDGRELVQTVLTATLRQLGQSGFAKFSVEDVARAAGVNKTSVYRRWPGKVELIVAALQSIRDQEPAFVESGDLRRDLTCILRRKVAFLSHAQGKKIARALLVLDEDGGETAAYVRTLREQQSALPRQIVERAIERGELRSDASPALLTELLLAPILHRALITGGPMNGEFIAAALEHFLRAAGVSGVAGATGAASESAAPAARAGSGKPRPQRAARR